VEGVGLRLQEYRVKSLAEKQIAVDEKMFLSPSIGPSILAVAVENHRLNSGKTSRVFVVEKKEMVQ